MSEGTSDVGSPAVPTVDHPRLAEALDGIRDLDDQPLTEHHERLVGVHDVLHDVLHPDDPHPDLAAG